VLHWLTKEQVPPAFYMDHVMVTKDNIDEFCSRKDFQPAAQVVA
jgi:hypothetical protein